MNNEKFAELFRNLTNFKENQFHPLVWINGDPFIGENVYIGGMSEINAKGAQVVIEDDCDIASFVSINCADSHKKCIGIEEEVQRKNIHIEKNVFIGSHSVIKGGAHIGHHSVIAAGTIVEGKNIPPYSLVIGNPMEVKEGYYLNKADKSNIIIPHNRPTIGKEEEKAVNRVMKSGWLAQGKEVESFENEFCEYLGLPKGHAVAVSSGSAALYLALWSLNAKDKTVAIPAYTCTAIKNAVNMAQGIELLIDSGEHTLNIDLDQLIKNKPDIAIIPHMYGQPVNIEKLKGIKVIEDCAQALGAKINGKFVGLHGNIGIFSFYATKIITSGGQGGMVVSEDLELVEKVRDFRQFDQRNDNNIRFNFQMTDLQAAIGREQLKKLDLFLNRRTQIYDMYQKAGVKLWDVDTNNKNSLPVRQRALVCTKNQNHSLDNLHKNRIKSIIPLEDWELLGDPNLFPNARKWTKELISIPIYPSLTDVEVQRVISVLESE